MSESRIKEILETKLTDDQRSKASDTLLKEAKTLFSEVIRFNSKTLLDKKLEEYRNKYHLQHFQSLPPLNSKKALHQVLLFSKASANMGNQEALHLFKKAKAYQNDQSVLEDEYILVQTPTDIEATFDFQKNEAVTLRDCKRKNLEEKPETINIKLHTEINFIHNWYPDPGVCVESPVKLTASQMQIFG